MESVEELPVAPETPSAELSSRILRFNFNDRPQENETKLERRKSTRKSTRKSKRDEPYSKMKSSRSQGKKPLQKYCFYLSEFYVKSMSV